jgi:nucleoside-diphosphate-sugar epimerase
MRVLVTGAAGFVGRWVAAALLQRGHHVIAVSRSGQPVGDTKSDTVSWCVADLLRQNDIESLLQQQQPEGLVHCAWDTTPGAYWTSPSNLDWVAASLQLLKSFAANGGQRVVIAGTSAEYSWQGTGPLHELSSLVAPNSLYGICKNSLREITERWAEETNLSWAWGRVFCPFGPGEKSDRLIPRLISQLHAGGTIPFDTGQLVRDFMSVEDLGDAFVAVLESTVQGCINLSSGDGVSIREVVNQLAQYSQDSQVNFGVLPDPPGQPARIVADVTRLQKEVGWTPQRTLEFRLREAAEWWLLTQSTQTADNSDETSLKGSGGSSSTLTHSGRKIT